MKAIVFTAEHKVQLTEIPDPVAGPGEVVIDIRASGICHTDFEVLCANYGSTFPIVPGHEYSGVVSVTGDGVTGVAVGDRVVVDPNLECGRCDACARGWAHLCRHLGAYGVTQNGGFAERCVVKASAVHKIGDMPFGLAALAEPMGCVLNGIDASNGGAAKSALVFGAGPMGLMMALALQTRGVGTITLVDRDPAKLALVGSFGLSAVAAGSAELEGLQHSFDLVVDATGVPAVAESMTQYVANGGTCHFFGVCPQDARIAVSPFEVFRRQLKLVGSHSLNHNIPEALEAIRKAGPAIGSLVSHQLSLEEVADIFSGRKMTGSLKIHACVG